MILFFAVVVAAFLFAALFLACRFAFGFGLFLAGCSLFASALLMVRAIAAAFFLCILIVGLYTLGRSGFRLVVDGFFCGGLSHSHADEEHHSGGEKCDFFHDK